MKHRKAKPKGSDIVSNVGPTNLSFRKTLRGHAVGPPRMRLIGPREAARQRTGRYRHLRNLMFPEIRV